MFRIVMHNLKHFFITFIILFCLLIGFGLYIGASAHLYQDPLAYKLDKEGPHIFYQGHSLSSETIRGRNSEGFYIEKVNYPLGTPFDISVYFPLEDTDFTVNVNPVIETPPTRYEDEEKIIAISDIESGFKAFRDFLMANEVIDGQLNWKFGRGHLVLVGDFVDRGDSVTQVLWFIYKLEQEAKRAGGTVHFILGNHEIKNMQANFQKATEKYYYIASMLQRGQHELYGNDSFIGRWMASKNSVEVINGYLFTHGGIHPKIAEMDIDLDQLNQIVRDNYRRPYFTKSSPSDIDFLISHSSGPSWYRGYFKDDLTDEQVEKGLRKFGAKAAIVGHTIQSKVTALFDYKVFAIDVSHPKDYLVSFPIRSSEGLLIDGNTYYRLLDDGNRNIL